MKATGIAIAIIVAICLLVAGGWAWRYYTAPIKGKVDAEVQIESAPNRIQKYENFYDMYATIQTDVAALNAQKSLLEDLKTDETASKSELSRVRTNVAALQAQIQRQINEYNADARKEYTDARFFPDDLPRKLTLEDFAG